MTDRLTDEQVKEIMDVAARHPAHALRMTIVQKKFVLSLCIELLERRAKDANVVTNYEMCARQKTCIEPKGHDGNCVWEEL